MATLEQKKELIHKLLDTNNRAVEKAVVNIYARQTADEQAAETTSHLNGKGFSYADAEFGSSLARGIHKYGHLTSKQMVYARKMMKRYWKQLIEIADAKDPSWADKQLVAGGAMSNYTVKAVGPYRYEVHGGSKVYVVVTDPTKKGARCSCPYGVTHHDKTCKHETLVYEFIKSITGPLEAAKVASPAPAPVEETTKFQLDPQFVANVKANQPDEECVEKLSDKLAAYARAQKQLSLDLKKLGF